MRTETVVLFWCNVWNRDFDWPIYYEEAIRQLIYFMIYCATQSPILLAFSHDVKRYYCVAARRPFAIQFRMEQRRETFSKFGKIFASQSVLIVNNCVSSFVYFIFLCFVRHTNASIRTFAHCILGNCIFLGCETNFCANEKRDDDPRQICPTIDNVLRKDVNDKNRMKPEKKNNLLFFGKKLKLCTTTQWCGLARVMQFFFSQIHQDSGREEIKLR